MLVSKTIVALSGMLRNQKEYRNTKRGAKIQGGDIETLSEMYRKQKKNPGTNRGVKKHARIYAGVYIETGILRKTSG
jgi:hypothetical protein